jgi:hypothetical protein
LSRNEIVLVTNFFRRLLSEVRVRTRYYKQASQVENILNFNLLT